jgi:hypothetical protein
LSRAGEDTTVKYATAGEAAAVADAASGEAAAGRARIRGKDAAASAGSTVTMLLLIMVPEEKKFLHGIFVILIEDNITKHN